ncbi:MAG TPA: hypothetical protein VGI19_06030 [Candidatus Cybelea sp.]|jgi:virginiamycin B lyase
MISSARSGWAAFPGPSTALRISFVALAILSLARCGAPSVATEPGRVSYAALRNVAEGKRGHVTLYADAYGDPLPTGITAGPDGALWFTDVGNDVVGRITTGGTYTMQQPAGRELSAGITVGPDKNLWFTLEEEYGGIGRITPKGVITLFPDPGGSYPQGITVGPDNALWFTESNGTVGRMTTKGKVKHFTVAPSNAELEGIVTGPDGNLWLTQYVVGGSRFSNAVIRMSTSGKYKSFKVGSGPDFICVGPDNALWFTEAAANALGRLTPSGKYQEFPIGYNAQPSGIATGPDGALWFSDFSGRAGIGRMTTRGKVRFYKVLGSDPQVVEIVPGPDGNMWFTTIIGPSAIGRITTH